MSNITRNTIAVSKGIRITVGYGLLLLLLGFVFLGRGFFGYPEPQVGPLPQKGPIYYVNAESPDHAEKCKNKTAGRELIDFQNSRLWLTSAA